MLDLFGARRRSWRKAPDSTSASDLCKYTPLGGGYDTLTLVSEPCKYTPWGGYHIGVLAREPCKYTPVGGGAEAPREGSE